MTSDERSNDQSVQRRGYLKAVGSASVLATTGLAGCLGDGGGTPTETGEEGPTKIVAGTAPGFPPFEMKEGGELKGFDIDLLEAVVSNADGYELEKWKTFEFKSLIPALTNDKIDVIAAALSITDERQKKIDYSNPYYSVDQAVLVREGASYSPSKLSDLAGHKVGAQKGTTGHDLVQDLIKKGTLKESNYSAYDSYVLAVEDLENKNLDAVVVDTPVAKTFAAERKVKIAFTKKTGENYGFGVRKQDDEFTKALNSGLKQVRESGRYQEITKKWFGK